MVGIYTRKASGSSYLIEATCKEYYSPEDIQPEDISQKFVESVTLEQ